MGILSYNELNTHRAGRQRAREGWLGGWDGGVLDLFVGAAFAVTGEEI